MVMIQFRFRSALIFLLIFFNATFNPAISQPSKYSREKFISKNGDTLNYRFLFPDYNLSRRLPLVVFLHGSGECGNDNDAQLKWGVMNFATDQMMSMHPCFVIAPQCPEKQEWANFNEDEKKGEMALNPSPSRAMTLVMELIRDLSGKFLIDSNRIYITGLSMGGYGTFDALSRYPGFFAAAVPVCGGGDVSKAPVFKNVPIWIFHGAEDPGVSPGHAVDMLAALRKAGAHPGCTIYPESGHFVWLATYTDQLMLEWLFRQHK